MGEDAGRFFMSQMLDVLEHMHGMNIVHRDLKPENILIDEQLNLKVADLGFATLQPTGSLLKTYRGTKTYMAPEIKKQQKYDGTQVDIFSTGVILFICVMGLFPFSEAKQNDTHYRHLINGNYDRYWETIKKYSDIKNVSDEFKQLM